MEKYWKTAKDRIKSHLNIAQAGADNGKGLSHQLNSDIVLWLKR